MEKPKTLVPPELMTKKDVAAEIQVSGRQVENLVKAGRLPQPIRLGSHPRWIRSELMAHIMQLTNRKNA